MNAFFKETIPEKGGIFGGKNGVVTEFEFDMTDSIKDRNIYIPNNNFYNSIIIGWQKKDIVFMGIIHSHPSMQDSLSGDDVEYIYKIFKNMPDTIQELYFPIALGNGNFISYKANIENGIVTISSDSILIVD